MSNCSGDNSAKEKPKPEGCTNAKDILCSSSAANILESDTSTATASSTDTATNTTSTTASSIDTAKLTPTAIALQTPLSVVSAVTQVINQGVAAANTTINEFKKSLLKFYSLRSFEDLDAIKNVDINVLHAALKIIEDRAINEIKHSNGDPEIIKTILSTLNQNNEKLIQDYKKTLGGTNSMKQSGGKKIISRTNKSINQFLNPKITFANMLKSKSKRKRITKTKSKKRRSNK